MVIDDIYNASANANDKNQKMIESCLEFCMQLNALDQDLLLQRLREFSTMTGGAYDFAEEFKAIQLMDILRRGENNMRTNNGYFIHGNEEDTWISLPDDFYERREY